MGRCVYAAFGIVFDYFDSFVINPETNTFYDDIPQSIQYGYNNCKLEFINDIMNNKSYDYSFNEILNEFYVDSFDSQIFQNDFQIYSSYECGNNNLNNIITLKDHEMRYNDPLNKSITQEEFMKIHNLFQNLKEQKRLGRNAEIKFLCYYL